MDMEIIIRYAKEEEHEAEEIARGIMRYPVDLQCTTKRENIL